MSEKPSPAVFRPETFAQQLISKFNQELGKFAPGGQPGGTMPTLETVPHTLSLDDALNLHTQASRWLNYVQQLSAQADLQVKACKAEADQFKQRQAFVAGSKGFDSLESMDKYHRLSDRVLEAQATASAYAVIEGNLTKIISSASRTISATGGSAYTAR